MDQSAWSAPKCPRCHWHLSFIARNKSWQAHCWNRYCPIEVVSPSLDDELAPDIPSHTL